MKNKIKFIPNFVTAFGLSCGLFVIHSMSMAQPGMVDQALLLKATILLVIAGVADVLDGALARAFKTESLFGGLFDALSDAITFGVGPTVIVQKTLSIEAGSGLSFLLMGGALTFSLSGVLRLVRFSLASKDEEENKNFIGLPIPGAAACLVSLNLVLAKGGILQCPFPFDAIILGLAMVVLGYFMVSRFKFPSLKALQFNVLSFQSVFSTVLVAVAIFYGMMFYLPVMAFLGSWGYFLLACCLSAYRLFKGRHSEVLKDFEPEPEDLNWE